MYREEWQDALDIVDERTKNNPELYQMRRTIVEHPFGTTKKVWGFAQFLCRRIPKVSAETALTFLAFNLRRVFNLFSGKIKELMVAIAA